jgi:hypothetical protein
LKPEILLGIQIAHSIYQEIGANLEITCGIDGTHLSGSLHYSGNAVDLGIHTIAENRSLVRNKIAAALGADFDLVWERIGTPEEHFHLEYQPKNSY